MYKTSDPSASLDSTILNSEKTLSQSFRIFTFEIASKISSLLKPSNIAIVLRRI